MEFGFLPMRDQTGTLFNSILIWLMVCNSLLGSASCYNYTEILYRDCDSAKNSYAGAFVSSLANRAFEKGFNVSVEKHGHEKTYGLIECRGDLNRKDCETCFARILAEMWNSCRNASRAWIQLEGCYIRYENEPFFWEIQNFYEVGHQCGGNLLNMQDFGDALQDVVYSAVLMNGFSAAKISNSSVYALASCNAYLNQDDCEACLMLSLYFLRFDCHRSDDILYSVQGETQILMDSCLLRFDKYRFFEREAKGSWWNLHFPSPPPRKLNKLAIALACGTAGVLVTTIATLLIYFRIRTKRKLMKVHCIAVDGDVPRLSRELSNAN